MGRSQQGQLISAPLGISWGGLKLGVGLSEGSLTHMFGVNAGCRLRHQLDCRSECRYMASPSGSWLPHNMAAGFQGPVPQERATWKPLHLLQLSLGSHAVSLPPCMASSAQVTSWSKMIAAAAFGSERIKKKQQCSQSCHVILLIVSHWPELIHVVTPRC